MGPHSFECGNIPTRPSRHRIGRSFNGAALVRVRKCAPHSDPVRQTQGASMGPHSFECGNSQPSTIDPIRHGASMGPHSFECGNLGMGVPPYCVIHASMGPHSFECGNWVVSQRHNLMSPRFNGAALVRVRKCRRYAPPRSPGSPASMGPHSFECGNPSTPGRPAAETSRFNGAALVRVRKSPKCLRDNGWQLMLQWGRTRSSAEIHEYRHTALTTH